MSNKLVLLLLNLIIVTLIGVSAIRGLAITENIKVNSVRQTKDLDVAYQEVLKNYDDTGMKFESAKKNQEKAKEQFEKAKQEFDQIKNINSYETLVELAAKREYNIEALWIKLGLIAENNELIHAFNVKQSEDTDNYSINVELTGSYSGIRNFIDDIMMDMDLMFKAEDVKIEGSGENLTATFVINNVNIIM